MDEASLIRNIGIVAHIDAGKTTISERILYYTGKNHKIGEVHEGAASMDWMSQEQERGITITSAATTCFWKTGSENYQINLIDTPGHVDFTIEVERSLRVLDGAVVVICGVSGVQPQTETIWRQADKYKIPRIIFVNKLDRQGADFEAAVNSVKEKFNIKALPVCSPYYEGGELKGLIDFVDEVFLTYSDEDFGGKITRSPVPEGHKELLNKKREALIEELGDLDDQLAEDFLTGAEITPDRLHGLIRKYVIDGRLVPVICGAAFRNKGVQRLLDGVCQYFPSPKDTGGTPVIKSPDSNTEFNAVVKCDNNEPLAALVFKIYSDSYAGFLFYVKVYSGVLKLGSVCFNPAKNKRERVVKLFRMHSNRREEITECKAGDLCACVGLTVSETGDTLCDKDSPMLLKPISFMQPVISSAVEAKKSDEVKKMLEAFHKIDREDPTFKVFQDSETGQTIISGMGELHLDIVVDRIAKEFGVAVNLGKPRVAYKESIETEAEVLEDVNRIFEGKNVIMEMSFRVSPHDQDETAVEVDEVLVPGGKPSVVAVCEGAAESLKSGVLSGYPLIKVKAKLISLKTNTELIPLVAFKFLAAMSIRKAIQQAKPVMLEPVMDVEVVCPIPSTGDVIGDLNSRSGKILSVNEKSGNSIVRTSVRLSQMFGYSTRLRSMTQGKATFSMEFDHYSKTLN